jgi:hypothetical protein
VGVFLGRVIRQNDCIETKGGVAQECEGG